MAVFPAGRQALAYLGTAPIPCTGLMRVRCAWYTTTKPTPSKKKAVSAKAKITNSAFPTTEKIVLKTPNPAKTTLPRKSAPSIGEKQSEPTVVAKPAPPTMKNVVPRPSRARETSARPAGPAPHTETLVTPIKPAGVIYANASSSAAEVTARPVADKAAASVSRPKTPAPASAPKAPDSLRYPRPLWEPPKPANPLKDPNSKEYKEKYRRETMRWTMIMTGGPVAIVTSYYLWDRIKYDGVPVHKRGGRDPLAPEENLHKKRVTF